MTTWQGYKIHEKREQGHPERDEDDPPGQHWKWRGCQAPQRRGQGEPQQAQEDEQPVFCFVFLKMKTHFDILAPTSRWPLCTAAIKGVWSSESLICTLAPETEVYAMNIFMAGLQSSLYAQMSLFLIVFFTQPTSLQQPLHHSYLAACCCNMERGPAPVVSWSFCLRTANSAHLRWDQLGILEEPQDDCDLQGLQLRTSKTATAPEKYSLQENWRSQDSSNSVNK